MMVLQIRQEPKSLTSKSKRDGQASINRCCLEASLHYSILEVSVCILFIYFGLLCKLLLEHLCDCTKQVAFCNTFLRTPIAIQKVVAQFPINLRHYHLNFTETSFVVVIPQHSSPPTTVFPKQLPCSRISTNIKNCIRHGFGLHFEILVLTSVTVNDFFQLWSTPFHFTCRFQVEMHIVHCDSVKEDTVTFFDMLRI